MLDTLDIPAWVTYSGLFLFGVIHSFLRVRAAWHPRLANWWFLETWLLFLGQALLPPVLMWLLDLLRVLHDTSFAGAILVATSYLVIVDSSQVEGATAAQQIGVKQAASWLRPFVRWLDTIRVHQDRQSELQDQSIRQQVLKQVRDEEQVAAKSGKTLSDKRTSLEQLALDSIVVTEKADFRKSLNGYRSNPKTLTDVGLDPLEAEVDFLLDAILKMPEAEGALTQKGFKLTGNVFHPIKDRWGTALGVFAALAAALYVIAPAPFACIFSLNCIADAFHGAGAQERATLFALFRITKTWTTDQDLSRNQRQLIDYLNSLSSEKRISASALVPGADDKKKKEAKEKFDEWNTFMEKLIWELQTPDLSPGRDNVILTVIYRGNPEDKNALCDILSKLPDALYAAQDGVRTNIQAELVRIAARLGASEVEAQAMQWKPGEKYSPGLVADYRNKWHQLKTQKCEGLLAKSLVPPLQTPAATTTPTVTPRPATPVAKSPVTAPAVTPPTASSTTPPGAGSDTSEKKEGEQSIPGPEQTPK